MKQTIINIYTFIRMANEEPSRFIQDDYETVEKELICIKQYGFPGTYALKYDALMEPRYQALLKKYLDNRDEISAWWEISKPLCIRAGVQFRGHNSPEAYTDPVDSAYSIGYSPEERKKLVDAYMTDFFSIWGKYPETIGSWILDPVTIQYAADHYGISGSAICRDQIATDGFTLWGGYPNGIYYPSRKNEFIPAQTEKNQISVPMFRLLGPDPIYNFEAEARKDLTGVFTLEPAWLTGRDMHWISWIFSRLTDEDSLGIGYAQVGQENNFLWENIEAGLKPQLAVLKKLHNDKNIRIETMGTSARWFGKQYIKTPPVTYQASTDWDTHRNLSAMWYASSCYRLGLLGEEGHLRIRDFFLFDENYPSRYLDQPVRSTSSLFDGLPILSPQLWKTDPDHRPFIRLLSENSEELSGTISYHAISESDASAYLTDKTHQITAGLTMHPDSICVEGVYCLHFDFLPDFRVKHSQIALTHNGFPYFLTIAEGSIKILSSHTLDIISSNNRITIKLSSISERLFRHPENIPVPVSVVGNRRLVPPCSPSAEPGDSVFPWGSVQNIILGSQQAGEIRYTTDGTEPTRDSLLYLSPVVIRKDTVLHAKVFRDDGTASEISRFEYRFGLKNIKITSPTIFDSRESFCGNGIVDLLQTSRGSLDYLCGRWRGTLDSLDFTAELDRIMKIQSITLGFLSHHRSGIVLPESIDLYTGPDKNHLLLSHILNLPCKPLSREIVKSDFSFPVNKSIGAFRIIAHRYDVLPFWSQYHGSKNVFTFSDSLIVVPEAEK